MDDYTDPYWTQHCEACGCYIPGCLTLPVCTPCCRKIIAGISKSQAEYAAKYQDSFVEGTQSKEG